MRRRTARALLACAAALGCMLAPLPLKAVDGDWPSFGYDYANSRHVPFHQIDAHNVSSLRLTWKFSSGTYGKFEATPVVRDGVLYVVMPPDDTVVALDAANGQVKWRYTPVLSPVKLCCGPVNRGVAVDREHVYVATLDARLIALERRTGAVAWEATVAPPAEGYSETMAPLAWNGLVVVGISGGDVGIGGFLTAYAAHDGKRLWRWYSVPHANGGGAIWMTPAVDKRRATLYAGTGNPFPMVDDRQRPGANLYSDSIVALDARRGTLRWYFQEVADDQWNYDATSPPVLVDAVVHGRRMDAVAQAGKTGWLYVLDRDRGRLLRRSEAFVHQHNMFARPTEQGVYASPAGGAGAIAPIAWNPRLGRVFVTAVDQIHFARLADPYWRPAGEATQSVTAIDVNSGRLVWRRQFPPLGTIDGGLNSTNGPLATDELVFVGEESTGRLDAFDARNGDLLWQFQTTAGEPGAGVDVGFWTKLRDLLASWKHALLRQPRPAPASHIHDSPITYVVGGTQYVAVGGDAFYRTGDSSGDTLYVFALPR